MSQEPESVNQNTQVSLRPVSADDEAFLQAVYATTRAEEMKHVPWNEAQQAAFLQMQFKAQKHHYETRCPDARHDIILFDSQSVGRLYVDRREHEIHVLDIALLPEYRGRGIGSSLIKALMEEASAAGKSLTIYVESFNPSQTLFARLGFHEIESDGINIKLERSPDA